MLDFCGKMVRTFFLCGIHTEISLFFPGTAPA